MKKEQLYYDNDLSLGLNELFDLNEKVVIRNHTDVDMKISSRKIDGKLVINLQNNNSFNTEAKLFSKYNEEFLEKYANGVFTDPDKAEKDNGDREIRYVFNESNVIKKSVESVESDRIQFFTSINNLIYISHYDFILFFGRKYCIIDLKIISEDVISVKIEEVFNSEYYFIDARKEFREYVLDLEE